MDSLTQIALGASVAGVAGIKPFGRKVLIAGALLGTVPDLDVLINYPTAIENYTYHRGFSHSIFVLSALSIFIYLLAMYCRPQLKQHKKTLFFVIFLPLITHPLLDAFTTYGTQLLWPIPMQPISWSSIFIIDPLYTIPLIIALIGLWRYQTSKKWQQTNQIILLLSCFYLAVGQVQAMYLKKQLTQDPVANNGIVFVSPSPFNIIYWRVISYQDDVYYEAFTTAFADMPLQWRKQETGRHLIDNFDSTELQRLEWFTGGLLRFTEEDGVLVAADLRMGLQHYYPFSFSLAEQNNGWSAIPSAKVKALDFDFKWLYEAIN